MHTCFIIDNSLPLQQKCVLGISILDYIKMSIELMIKQLFKTGFYHNRNDILHLYVTSNPSQHLSSYQHDRSHFDYQLKNIQSRALTYPAETLSTALKQLGKYRILTETETLLGYRQATIYEPALILFFSSQLSERKIQAMRKPINNYQMRSQYKFIHFRLCLPLKVQRSLQNIQTLKRQLEKSQQYKNLCQLAYKLCKGQFCAIYYTSGKQALYQHLISLMNSYRPGLCVDLNHFQFHANPYPDILINTQLPALNAKWDQNQTKLELSRSQQDKNRSKIPFSQQIKVLQRNYQFSINQINIPQFYVDFSYKLSFADVQKQLKNLPFEHYHIKISREEEAKSKYNTNILNLQRILVNANAITTYFPLWSKKKNQYLMRGFLCLSSGKYAQFLITFANCIKLWEVITVLQSRKNYSDQKRSEIVLKQYLETVPKYELYFLNSFFQHNFGIQIPIDRNMLSHQIAIQNKIKATRADERKKLQIILEENIKNHQNNQAKCCPIYNRIQFYKQFSKLNTKIKSRQSLPQKTFYSYLQKIDDFHKKIGLSSYFSARNTQKLMPVTRELQKNRSDIEEYNINIMTNINRQDGKRRKKNEIDTLIFSEDTPFPEDPDNNPNRDTTILEVEQTLIENKRAVEMGSNIQIQHQQIVFQSISEPEKQKVTQMQSNSDQKEDNKIQKEINTNLQILQFINGIKVQHKKKMIINPSNIRNNLFVKNKEIIEKFRQQ